AGRDVADHCGHHRFAIFLRSSQLSARGFCLLAHSSPNVQLKRQQIEQHAAEATRSSTLAWNSDLAVSRSARARHIRAQVKLRKLFRACEAEIRSRRIDARNSRTKIVVTDHRGLNEIL